MINRVRLHVHVQFCFIFLHLHVVVGNKNVLRVCLFAVDLIRCELKFYCSACAINYYRKRAFSCQKLRRLKIHVNIPIVFQMKEFVCWFVCSAFMDVSRFISHSSVSYKVKVKVSWFCALVFQFMKFLTIFMTVIYNIVINTFYTYSRFG